MGLNEGNTLGVRCNPSRVVGIGGGKIISLSLARNGGRPG